MTKETDVLNYLSKPDICQYLDKISQVHMYTKHYLLIAEEISNEGVAFLQPLKEHRDAYDHLMRIFAVPIKIDIQQTVDTHDYILDNVKKAFGHEYRAFFDTADWFTYICRKYIREELSLITKEKKYKEKFDDFEEVKNFINQLPFDIAKYREDKDISHHESVLSEVLSYKNTMDRLLTIYMNVKSL